MDRVRTVMEGIEFQREYERVKVRKDEDCLMIQKIHRFIAGIKFAAKEFEETQPWLIDNEHEEDKEEAEDYRLASVCKTLDKMVITSPESLPGEDRSCPICFSLFEELNIEIEPKPIQESRPAMRALCGHVYCKSCWWHWLYETERSNAGTAGNRSDFRKREQSVCMVILYRKRHSFTNLIYCMNGGVID
jgi:hypothetical protein